MGSKCKVGTKPFISGERVFFDGEEYVLQPDGELKLVRSEKELKQKLIAIEAKLPIKMT